MRRLTFSDMLPLRIASCAVIPTLALLATLNTTPAISATINWTGAGDGTSFSDGDNWLTNVPPIPTSNLVFGNSSALGPNNDTVAFEIEGITFSEPAMAYTITGLGITLNSGLGIINNSDSIQSLDVASFTLGSALSFKQTTAAGSLLIGADVDNGGNALTFNAATGSTSTISGVISGGGSLDKDGDGTLVISAVNTYTGGTNVNGGTLRISQNESIRGTLASRDLDVSSGAVFDVDGLNQSIDELTGAGTVALGSGVIAVFHGDFSGDITGSGGTVVKKGAGTLTLSGTNTYSGQTEIRDSGEIMLGSDNTIDDASVLNISSVNATFNMDGHTNTVGGLTGAGSITNIGILIVDQSTDTTFSGVIDGSHFTKRGAGSLTLSGANLYTGLTTIAGGTLQVAADNNLGSGGGQLTFDGGTLKTTASFSTTRPVSLLGIGIFDTDGATTLTLDGNVGGAGGLTKDGTGTLVLNNTALPFDGNANVNAGTLRLGPMDPLSDTTRVTVALGATLDLDDNGERFGSLAGAGDVTLGASAGTILAIGTDGSDATFSGVISESGIVRKDGTGTLVLSGVNTYTGETRIEGGTLEVSANNNLGDASNLLSFDAGTLKVTSSFSMNRFTLLNTGGGAFDVDGGTTTLTQNANIDGIGSLTKSGDGTLILNGAVNSYTGDTHINAGTLQLGDGNALSANNRVVLAGGAALDLGGFNESFGSIEGAGNVVLGGGVMGAGTNGNSTTFSGQISGAGGVRKLGAGTLILNGENMYTGTTTIEGGVLQVSADNNLGDASTTLEIDDATLKVTDSFTTARATQLTGNTQVLEADGVTTTLTHGGTISGTGSLSIRGTGAVVLTGMNTYTGATNVEGGILQVAAEDNLSNASTLLRLNNGTLKITDSFTTARTTTLFNMGGTFDIDGSTTTLTHNGVIEGSASALTKSGDGTLVLGAANTFQATVHIDGGVLQVSADNNLGSGSNQLTFGGGTLTTTASFTTGRTINLTGDGTFDTEGLATELTVTGPITGLGALTKEGSGTLIFDISNTFSGDVDINAGTLRFGAGDVLDNFSRVTVALGGTLEVTDPGGEAFGSLAGAGNVAFGVEPTTALVVGSDGSDTTFSGVISGIGSVRKFGPGTMVLAGANTFTGETRIEGGTLEVSADENLGNAGNSLLFSFGTLKVTDSFFTDRLTTLEGSGTFDIAGNTTTLTHNGNIGGPGSLIKNGLGTLVLNGVVNSYFGNTHINAGTLRFGAGNALSGNNRVLLAGGATLDLDGFDETFGSLAGAGDVLLGAGEMAVGGNGTSTTYSGQISGAGSLTKRGAGTLILSGENLHTGATNIEGGTLQVSADNNLGDASATLLLDGGTLKATESFATARATSLVDMGGTFDVDGMATSLTHGGTIGGTGSLGKSGAGILVLSGANTYTGETRIEGGTLDVLGDNNLGNAANPLVFDTGTLKVTNSFSTGRLTALNAGGGTFDIDGSATILTHNEVISGAGVLTKTGDGTLVLNAANTHTGSITLSGGTLQVAGNDNLGSGTNPLTFDGGTLKTTGSFMTGRTFTLAGDGAIDTDGMSTELIVSGPFHGLGTLAKEGLGTLVLDVPFAFQGDVDINAGTLRFGPGDVLDFSRVTIASGATLAFLNDPFGEAFGSIAGEGDVAFGVIPTTELAVGFDDTDTTLSGVISGSGIVRKVGTGTMVLSGASTYTGETRIAGGTLEVSADTNLGDAGNPLIFSGTSNTLKVTDSFTTSRATTLAGGGTFEIDGSTMTLTHDGVLGGGGGFLTKGGGGTLVLNAANTYAGGINLNGGTLQVSADNNLGSGGNPLTFDGGTLKTTGSFMTGRTFTLAGDGAIDTDGMSTELIVSGPFHGLGTLAKEGLGTLVLDVPFAFQGDVDINAGTLRFGPGDVLDFSRVTIASGATLAFLNDPFGEAFGSIAGEGDVAFGVIPTTELAVGFDDTDTTLSGVISGSGIVRKVGTGTMVLSGASTYTGETRIEGGTLQVSADNNLGNASNPLSLNGSPGTLRVTGSFTTSRSTTLNGGGTFEIDGSTTTLTHDGVIGGGGLLTKEGDGTLVLNATNTHAGVIRINAGTLQVAADDNLGHIVNTLLLFNGGALKTTSSFSMNRLTALDGSGGIFDIDGSTTTLTQNAGISGTGSLTKNGLGTLALNAANTYAGDTQINAGTVRVSADNNLGAGGELSFGSAVLAGTLNTTGTFSTSRTTTLNAGGGTFDTDASTTLTHGGVISGPGALTKAGLGTLLLANDANSYSGDTNIDGGTLQLGASSALANGHVTIAASGTLDNNGFSNTIAALTNDADFALSGGSLIVTGAFTNRGTAAVGNTMSVGSVLNDFGAALSLQGTVGGAVDNNGALEVTGTTTISGATTNLGEITNANVLNANGGLLNFGTVSLTGGALTGAGGAQNSGVISGRGALTAALTNSAGGTIRAAGGLLNVTSFTGGNGGNLQIADGASLNVLSALNSSGLISLEGASATLGGGNALTSQGTLAGIGTVSKIVANEGTVRAEGGRLTMAAAGNTNTATGTIQAGFGSDVFYTQGLASNAGNIALTGGSFDNNNQALTNDLGGSIAGRGTIRTGGLVNDGAVNLANGNSDVIGAVGNSVGATIDINNATVAFFDEVTNDGTFTSNQSTVNFLGGFVNNGTLITDPNIMNFVNWTNNHPAAVIADAGDEFIVSNDLLGDTASNALWDTDEAILRFVAGQDGAHNMQLYGIDLGADIMGYADNFAWGMLEVQAGQTLALEDAKNDGQTGALYVDTIVLADFGADIIDGTLDLIFGDSHNIYYRPHAAGNLYLGGLTYDLGGGGQLIAAVPIPGSLPLFGSVLAVLSLLRRRGTKTGPE